MKFFTGNNPRNWGHTNHRNTTEITCLPVKNIGILVKDTF